MTWGLPLTNTLSATDKKILAHLQQGLPLCPQPYLQIAEAVGCSETEVIDFINQQQSNISRFGLVIQHREIGFVHNAMVVWDIADDKVDELANQMAAFPFVNLCYRRNRITDKWPYNLFIMIHARSQQTALEKVEFIKQTLALATVDYAVLFSEKAYKQRGAHYV